jgi:hypothetical protein
MATLAGDGEIPSLPSSPRGRLSSRSSGYATPPAKSPSSLARSPTSASTVRTTLSNHSSMTSSRSMPRLHQPTVVRSTSGKGVSFLPPPGRLASSSTTSSLGKPRSSRGSTSARHSLPAGSGQVEPDKQSHGQADRPRPISYLSELGPPIRGSPIPKSRIAAGAGDKAAEQMLKAGIIEVKGGRSPTANGAGPAIQTVQPVVPYGIERSGTPSLKSPSRTASNHSVDSARKGTPVFAAVPVDAATRKKEISRDRPIDHLFPAAALSAAPAVTVSPDVGVLSDGPAKPVEIQRVDTHAGSIAADIEGHATSGHSGRTAGTPDEQYGTAGDGAVRTHQAAGKIDIQSTASDSDRPHPSPDDSGGIIVTSDKNGVLGTGSADEGGSSERTVSSPTTESMSSPSSRLSSRLSSYLAQDSTSYTGAKGFSREGRKRSRDSEDGAAGHGKRGKDGSGRSSSDSNTYGTKVSLARRGTFACS